MRRILAAGVLVLGVACATSDPQPVPAASAIDPTVAQMQTSLTELLERIDVLNHRLGRLEESRAEVQVPSSPPAAAQQAPAQSRPAPVSVPAERPAPAAAAQRPAQAEQPALAAARIANDYRQAMILFGRGSHGDARRGFEAVFAADPSGDLADNALFWIGESHFATREYTTAIRFYSRVVNEYPEQNKAPDAMFKLALAIERTGDLAHARTTFQQLIERYPYSTPASAAKKELQRIRY